MVNTSFTFHLGIQEGGIAIVAFHLCQCMVEWHESHSIEVIKKWHCHTPFHYNHYIVEWHESHST